MPAKSPKRKANRAKREVRFEPAKIDALFTVLDAVAWIDTPTCGQIAQFAGIDPRTAGKLLKNALAIGLVDTLGDRYTLVLPYPYRGSIDQKRAVVREALVRLPLLTSIRQFMALGDDIAVATRKAATIAGVKGYAERDFAPLLEWADSLGALQPGLVASDLVDEAVEAKERRHETDDTPVAFLSHSSKDKAFIRQLAADLTANGVRVWLDEQRIRVGDSIPEKIAQGLAASDYFLLAISHNSVHSEWVKRELNAALVSEVERRHTRILPLRLDDSTVPALLSDKKYADFSTSYKTGLDDLIRTMRATDGG